MANARTNKMEHIIGLLVLLICISNAQGNEIDKSCFCQLKGEIDDCMCSIETLDSFNNYRVFPLLHRLLQSDFFRFYKVNMFKDCPFESDHIGKCGSKSCAVDECSEDTLPPGLKKSNASQKTHKNKYSAEANKEDCKDENELSQLDTHISENHSEAFKDWKEYDDKQENFCEPEDEDSPDAVYYDLVRNPERFTGYTGPSAVNVWKLIYDQNCFKPDKYDMKTYLTDQGLCLEKRVFFRMISGFHTSINVDVTANWLIPAKTPFGDPSWGPNVDEFRKRFDPDKTWGEGPKRLKNLYFTYLVELRALAKAAPYLEQEDYYTGDEKVDSEIRQQVHEILHIAKSFSSHFDESKLFKGDTQELKDDFKVHFRNISSIMDCVGCDKCRLWGKLQIQGMGTALKILFSGDSMEPHSTVTQSHKKGDIPFQLTRGEIVALFNAFGRLSQSIHEIETFRQLIDS